jgi:hypothetical protein
VTGKFCNFFLPRGVWVLPAKLYVKQAALMIKRSNEAKQNVLHFEYILPEMQSTRQSPPPPERAAKRFLVPFFFGFGEVFLYSVTRRVRATAEIIRLEKVLRLPRLARMKVG